MPCALSRFPQPRHLVVFWALWGAGNPVRGWGAGLTSSPCQRCSQPPYQRPLLWTLMLSLSCWEDLKCRQLPSALLKPLRLEMVLPDLLFVLFGSWTSAGQMLRSAKSHRHSLPTCSQHVQRMCQPRSMEALQPGLSSRVLAIKQTYMIASRFARSASMARRSSISLVWLQCMRAQHQSARLTFACRWPASQHTSMSAASCCSPFVFESALRQVAFDVSAEHSPRPRHRANAMSSPNHTCL